MSQRQRADALVARAAELRSQGRTAEAVDAYQEAIEAFEGYAAFRFIVADLLWEDERYDEAAAVYARVVEDAPGHDQAWECLGEHHLRAGRHDLAAAAFDHAVEANPDAALAWWYAAMVHALDGDTDAARDRLARALALQPRWARRARREALLRPLLED